MNAIHAPLIQVLTPAAGGPAFFHESTSAKWEGWSATQARLGKNRVDGLSALRIHVAPIALRGYWQETSSGRKAEWRYGRPGDGWRSRVHLLAWLARVGPVIVSVGGIASDGVLAAYALHERAVYDEIDATRSPAARWAISMTLEATEADSADSGALVGVRGTVMNRLYADAVAAVDSWLARHGGDAALTEWRHAW